MLAGPYRASSSMTPSPTTIAATAAAAADSGPRPPTANTNKKPNWRRHTATLGSALLLLCALLHPLLAARGFLGPGGCLLMVNAATAPAKAGSGSASAASSASSLLHVGHNRRGGAAAMEVQQQQEQQEQEKRGKQQGGAGGFAAALGEGGRRLVAKGARKLAGRVRAVLHREIEALQVRERGRVVVGFGLCIYGYTWLTLRPTNPTIPSISRRSRRWPPRRRRR